jgi:hypothetical protein
MRRQTLENGLDGEHRKKPEFLKVLIPEQAAADYTEREVMLRNHEPATETPARNGGEDEMHLGCIARIDDRVDLCPYRHQLRMKRVGYWRVA